MTTLAFRITNGRLGRAELMLYDLSQPIVRPVQDEAPPFVLLERIPIGSTAEGATIAHKRGAIPVPEKE